MPLHMKSLILSALNEKRVSIKDSKICILGYAFLNDSDDTRNTPALPLYNLLKDVCRDLVVHDPYVRSEEGIALNNDITTAMQNADCIALVTAHSVYHDLSLKTINQIVRTPIIVDGRNVFNKQDCISAGFTYRGVGIG